jgi:hypothetical protein
MRNYGKYVWLLHVLEKCLETVFSPCAGAIVGVTVCGTGLLLGPVWRVCNVSVQKVCLFCALEVVDFAESNLTF